MTNCCNLACKNCCTPTTKYTKGFIEDRTVLLTLARTVKGQTLNYHRQGEPLLHKELEKYIRWGVETGIKPVISTNGLLLTEDRLRALYENGLRHLVITLHTKESFKAFKTACQFFEANNIQVRNFSNRHRKYTEDIMFFSGKILEFPEDKYYKEWIDKELEEVPDEYRIYLQPTVTHTWAGNVEGTKQDHSKEIDEKRKKCYFINRRVVNVRWDGSIVGCCFDSENDNEIGDIRKFENVKIDLSRYNLCKHCDSNWAIDN